MVAQSFKLKSHKMQVLLRNRCCIFTFLGYKILEGWGVILGPLRHVLHLVWSDFAIKTALKVAQGPESWEKEGQL